VIDVLRSGIVPPVYLACHDKKPHEKDEADDPECELSVP